jgi:hypothetical protein
MAAGKTFHIRGRAAMQFFQSFNAKAQRRGDAKQKNSLRLGVFASLR